MKSNIDEKEETKIRLMRALVEKQDPSSKVYIMKQEPSLLYYKCCLDALTGRECALQSRSLKF